MTAIGLLNTPSRPALASANTTLSRHSSRADSAFADLLAERIPPKEADSSEASASDQQEQPAADGAPEDSSDDLSQAPVDQTTAPEPDKNGQPSPETPVPTGQSDPVITIRDVAKELIHAATIDLAAIAKDEMIDPKAAKHPGPPEATLTRAPRHDPLTASWNTPARGSEPIPGSAVTDLASQQTPTTTPQPARPDARAEIKADPPLATGSDPNLAPRQAAPVVQPTSKPPEQPGTVAARVDLLTRLTGSAEAARGAVTAVDRVAIQAGLRQEAGATALNRPAEGMGRTNRDAILQTVQRGLASMLSQGGGKMTVVLRPEHLGEVRVQLEARRGTVNARLTAETEAARRTLESGADQLRTSLESRGVRVESIRIDGPASEGERTDPGRPDADTRDPSGHEHHTPRNGRGHRSSVEEVTEPSDQPRRTSIWTDIGIDTVV